MEPVKGFSVPPSFDEGMEGYHSDNQLKLKNQAFRSQLSSGSYASLTKVKAPSLKSGYYCELDDCQIGTVKAKSYCKVEGSSINNLQSEYYVDVRTSGIKSINASSYVKAKKSTIESIDSEYYVDLETVEQVKFLRAKSHVTAEDTSAEVIKSKYYVDLTRCKSDSVKADSYVKAKASTVGSINSGYYVDLDGSTASDIHCTRLEGAGSKMVSIHAEDSVNIQECEVIEKVEAADMVGSQCSMLGALKITSSVSLVGCENIAEIAAEQVSLKNCRVLGNVDASKVSIRNSTVEGELRTANRECKLLDSHVKVLFVKQPRGNPQAAGQDGDVGDLPEAVASIVQLVKSGAVRIALEGGGYHITVGDPASRNWGCSRVQMNNITISSTGGGGVSMRGDTVKIGNITMNIAKKNIAAALEHIEQSGRKREINLVAPVEPKKQVVTICGGNVEEVIFEEAGGVIICEKGGSVGKVRNGAEQEEKHLIAAEPPEHFIDPVHFTVMTNPYITPLKHVFDYATLVQLADKKTKDFVCPLTRQKYNLAQCQPANELKAEITEWLKIHKPLD